MSTQDRADVAWLKNRLRTSGAEVMRRALRELRERFEVADEIPAEVIP